MNPENLVLVCATAFTAVFVLLTILAVVMDLIMRVFPKTASEGIKPRVRTGPTAEAPPPQQAISTSDPARIAAIVSAYRQLFPDKYVVRIEEISS